MESFDTRQYGPHCEELLQGDRMCDLGPGAARPSARARLQALTVDDVFAGQPIRDREMAEACLAGLWLLHDFLDESHRLSQQIHSTTGSYWHGIMHRREPDYANAKYWFRRVGRHPVYPELCVVARELAEQAAPDPAGRFLVDQPQWDAARFVDFCADIAQGRSAGEQLGCSIARAEWELLFDFSYQHAVGNPRR
jgi:hypothetical protein